MKRSKFNHCQIINEKEVKNFLIKKVFQFIELVKLTY